MDITDKRKSENRVLESEKRLKIQYTIAELLSSSNEPLHDTLNKIIETFCILTSWDSGFFWMLKKGTTDPQELINISCWQSPQIQNREFETLTRRITFKKGIGLPGRVWQSGKSSWIQDVTNDNNFPRIHAARKTGLHGAFGYPIFFNNTFLGVIEFFSSKVHEPDMDLIEMFEASSKQIAQYIIRKQSEELIKESEEKYKLLVEEASDIIYRTDANGKFTYINSIAERIMKINKQQIIGKHFTNLVRPDWRKKTEQFYFDQFKNRVTMTYFEFPTLDSRNREIWIGQNVRLVTEGNTVKGFHAVARDVSEKVRAQQELKKNEEKYRGIIENLDLGILEVDKEGRVIKAYEKYCQLTGYSEKELIGKKANLLLLDPEQQNIMDLENNKRLSGDSSVYEIQLNCKNGVKKWVLISGSPIFDEDNNIVGSIGIHLDITQRKESEEKLLLAKQAAENSQKAKEQFLANMSHEIRTPMSGILGMSKLLNGANLSGKHKEYLKSIQTSATNLLVIINDILDLSKIEAGKLTFETIGFRMEDIVKISKETVNYLAIEKDLFITLNIDERLKKMVLIGDPTRLTQILTNLLNNAIKFTNYGEIKVETKIHYESGTGINIEFTVSDTGIGIPEEKLHSIFEIFNQADISTTRKFGGTGLGLSICKKLVELQHGEISVQSTVNKGTCFTFHIPFIIGTENDIPAVEETFSNEGLKGINILLVEDHIVNQVYATSILEDQEIHVDLAENGKEAIDKLRLKNYDLILMDMQMPVMGGIEATQIIRKELNLVTPIIALTANAISGESDKCLNAGMNDFVSKPFKDIELLNKISKLLNINRADLIDRIAEEKSEPGQNLYSLNKLNEMSHGKQEFVNKMVQLFKTETPKSIHLLNEHLSKKEYDLVGAVAHRMRPFIQMMDVLIKDELLLIEEYCKHSRNLDQLTDLIQKVSSVCTKVVSIL